MQRQAVALGVVIGERRIGLHHRVRDLGVMEPLLAHEVGGGKTRNDIAECLIDFAFDVAGFVRVQQRRTGGARGVGGEIRRQRGDVEFDGRERSTGDRGVVGGNRGDGLATIADALARERKLVLRDRDHAVGDIAIIAGDYRVHAGQRTGTRRVDAPDLAVRDGAPQDRADQCAAGRQVCRIACLAGDFLDTIDQRLAHADRGLPPQRCDRLRPRVFEGTVVHRALVIGQMGADRRLLAPTR